MSKTGKVLQTLRLFSEERPQLRVADVARLLSISTATAYRYVDDLEAAGLIEASAPGRYVLGPTIVELDRQIREHDPLIAAAADIMRTLSERTGGTTILARLHGRKVVSVHQVRGRHGPDSVSYTRGRAMPLYRGATSKIILAHLNRQAIVELVDHDSHGLRKAGLPFKLEPLLDYLATLRVANVIRTEGEVDADVQGWGVAIRHGNVLMGSLSVVLARNASDIASQRIATQLHRAGLRIEGRLDAAH